VSWFVEQLLNLRDLPVAITGKRLANASMVTPVLMWWINPGSVDRGVEHWVWTEACQIASLRRHVIVFGRASPVRVSIPYGQAIPKGTAI
jgi:hypothetical protein